MTRDSASAAPRLYHTVTAHIRDYDGSVYWTAGACPHDGRGDNRDCKWGEAAPDCLFDRWDRGDHHPDCGGGCDEHVFDGVRHQHCWGAEPPDYCDGFYHSEAGHCHPAEGVCGLIESISIGWEEAVVWSRDAEGTPILGPVPVSVAWPEGGAYAELTPVTVDAVEVEAGDVR